MENINSTEQKVVPNTLNDLVETMINILPEPLPADRPVWLPPGAIPYEITYDTITDAHGNIKFGREYEVRELKIGKISVAFALNEEIQKTRILIQGNGNRVWFSQSDETVIKEFEPAVTDPDFLPGFRRVLNQEESDDLIGMFISNPLSEDEVNSVLTPNSQELELLLDDSRHIDKLNANFRDQLNRIEQAEREAALEI